MVPLALNDRVLSGPFSQAYPEMLPHYTGLAGSVLLAMPLTGIAAIDYRSYVQILPTTTNKGIKMSLRFGGMKNHIVGLNQKGEKQMERLSLRRRLLICYGAGNGPRSSPTGSRPNAGSEYDPNCHSRQRTRPGLLEAFPGLWLKQGLAILQDGSVTPVSRGFRFGGLTRTARVVGSSSASPLLSETSRIPEEGGFVGGAVGYLVDTCTISELGKKRPSPAVAAWFQAVAPERLFASVLTVGELRRGVEGLQGLRRQETAEWMESALAKWFGDRLLPVDEAVALEWGKLTGRPGRTLPEIDSILAATARRHRLTIVTRNVADFKRTGVDLLNPWTHSMSNRDSQ